MADKDLDNDPGTVDPKVNETPEVSPQTSSFERNKTLKRVIVGVAAFALIGLTYVVISYSNQGPKVAQTTPTLPPSEPVFNRPAPPEPARRAVPSRLEITPATVTFSTLTAGKDRQVASLTVRAVNGPVNITAVTLPFADQSGLDMRANGCLKQLAADESCGITIAFAPTAPVILSNQVLINGTGFDMTGDTQGAARPVSTLIEINGNAVEPPPPPPPPPTPVVVDTRADMLAASQAEYLRRRQTVGALAAQGQIGYQPPPPSTAANWGGIGFAANESTLPVDMTRVVTMDKPIPAVIKIAIDTRRASRAVATVERDIYGGDGRTVLIERGSTMIGRVASISSTGEESVPIQWQRLVRPDGAAFAFEATSGDAMGRSGVLANIDNRFFERFGKTFLASIVSGGITIALDPQSTSVTTNGTTASGITGSITTGGTTQTSKDGRTIASEQLRQDFQPLYEQYKKEQLAIPPIRIVPAGTRITVWPTTDLWLKQVPANEPILTPAPATGQQAAAYRQSQMPSPGQQATVAPQYQPQTASVAPQATGQPAVYGAGPSEPGMIAPQVNTNLENESASEKLRLQLDQAERERAALRAQQQAVNPFASPGVAGAAAQATAVPPWAISR